MITEWVTAPEPVQPAVFQNPSYAVDLQILSAANGIVMVTPDGNYQYRVYMDFDGAITSEFVAPFSGIIPAGSLPVTPPFPVFGQVFGDLLILNPGSGIIMPNGLSSQFPRTFSRLRIDNDGDVARDPDVSLGFWVRIPENSIPALVDDQLNWIFTQDVIMITPGSGIVIPMRGGPATRRLRFDSDGALLSE